MTLWFEILLLGFVAATITTSTAIGWGVIMIPMLILYFRLEPSVAVGVTMIGYLLCGGAVAVLRLRAGSVDWALTAAVGLGGAIGALVGTSIDAYLPAAILKKVLGVMTILGGIAILFSKP